MKTLYERLKNEHIDCLNKEANNSPAIVEAQISELKKKYAILDMTYGCVVCLAHSLNLPNSNIDTIMNLFEANELLNVNSK